MQNNELVSRSLVGAEGWPWLPLDDAPGVLGDLLSFHCKEMLCGEKELSKVTMGPQGAILSLIRMFLLPESSHLSMKATEGRWRITVILVQ